MRLRRLSRIIWETSRSLTVVSVVLRLLRAPIPFATLWITKLIIDAVAAVLLHKTHNESLSIWSLFGIECLLAVFSDLLNRATALTDSIMADRFGNAISVLLMKHASTIDVATFEDPRFHEKLERVRRQTNGRIVLLVSFLNSFQDLASLLFLSSGLIFISPWLLVLLLAAILPSFWGETRFNRLQYSLLYKRTPERRQLDYLRFLGASVQTVKEVRTFGLAGLLLDRFQALSHTLLNERKHIAVKHAYINAALNLISTAGYYGGYATVLTRTLSGAMSLGGFAFVTRTFYRCRSHMERIFSNLAEISDEAVYFDNLFKFLEVKPLVKSCNEAILPPRRLQKGLEFRDVTFSYPGSGRVILKNLSFVLSPGETVAVIGNNGCGKSTLVKLLTRLYDPTSGVVTLDGVDLREYNVEALRTKFSVMFQDFVRYESTVRDNIGFGDLSCLFEESRLKKAIDKTSGRKLIDRLPQGYDQLVGRRFDGGIELSGGEWQKLALARTYLRDADVLILDEPSASLDARAEYNIFSRFASISENKIAVLISHRFSTVRGADRIMVIHDGQIQEQGNHNELLRLGRRYAEMFEMQAARYR